jgi:hypothetical protein
MTMIETPLVAWLILGGVVLFAALAGVVLWLGRRIRYPKGNRIDRTGNGFSVVVVVVPDIDAIKLELLADRVLLAAECAAQSWIDLGLPGDPKSALDGLCCYYLDDLDFDTPVPGSIFANWLPDQAAYLAQVPRATGSGPPMPVIRSRFIDTTIKRGQPVMHELLHAMSLDGGLPYRGHDDPRIWEGAGINAGLERHQIAETNAVDLFLVRP